MRDGLKREADAGELLRGDPQAAGEAGVLCGGGAGDELGGAAHVGEVAGACEAVAGDVGDGGVQRGQGALLGALRR